MCVIKSKTISTCTKILIQLLLDYGIYVTTLVHFLDLKIFLQSPCAIYTIIIINKCFRFRIFMSITFNINSRYLEITFEKVNTFFKYGSCLVLYFLNYKHLHKYMLSVLIASLIKSYLQIYFELFFSYTM